MPLVVALGLLVASYSALPAKDPPGYDGLLSAIAETRDSVELESPPWVWFHNLNQPQRDRLKARLQACPVGVRSRPGHRLLLAKLQLGGRNAWGAAVTLEDLLRGLPARPDAVQAEAYYLLSMIRLNSAVQQNDRHLAEQESASLSAYFSACAPFVVGNGSDSEGEDEGHLLRSFLNLQPSWGPELIVLYARALYLSRDRGQPFRVDAARRSMLLLAGTAGYDPEDQEWVYQRAWLYMGLFSYMMNDIMTAGRSFEIATALPASERGGPRCLAAEELELYRSPAGLLDDVEAADLPQGEGGCCVTKPT